MTFIDWSDPEGMFGLLIEYVADERNESVGDPARQKFLTQLLTDLTAANERSDITNPAEAIRVLKSIHSSIGPQFKEDEVVAHLADCIAELEQIP